MKKSRIKVLLTVGVTAVLAMAIVAGCSSTEEESGTEGTTEETTEETSGTTEANYPMHVASAEAGEGLAGYHMNLGLGYDCTTCHGDDLDAQVAAYDSDEELALTSTFYVDTETCLQSGCHTSWETVANRTSDLGDYNPHSSIHGTIEDCNECHKGHSSQVDICGECHSNGGQTMID